MSGTPSLSIVIPAYDEAARIGPFLDSVLRYARASSASVEVIVVDDGSSDGTAQIAAACADDRDAFRVVRIPENRGKGAAVRVGLAEARGRHRVFLDADGSTPVGEVDGLLVAVAGAPDTVAVGSIGIGDSEVEQSQVWVRQLAGRIGNLIIRALVLPGMRDTQRGCKLLSAEVCDAVLPHCRIDGWAFDVELLALARALGYPVVEVPIRWEHRAGSKVRAGSYVQTLVDVVRIRRRLATFRKAGGRGDENADATSP